MSVTIVPNPESKPPTITGSMKGKTVSWVGTDEKLLVIGLTNGQEVRIKWVEGSGPELDGVGVRVRI